jgi:hypothetical protein
VRLLTTIEEESSNPCNPAILFLRAIPVWDFAEEQDYADYTDYQIVGRAMVLERFCYQWSVS